MIELSPANKDIFKVAGAILFGAYTSTLFIFIAEIGNVFILFYLARSLGRNFVEQSLRKSARYSNLDEKLGGVSFFWLFLLRFVPLVPFRFLDLACGLTKISFRRYLAAAILGSPVRIFWIQYVLSAVGKSVFTNPLALSEYLLQNKAFLFFTIAYFILVILVFLKIRKG
ncbi:MAG: VTT domain-containing protein [Candidatus Omnitrophica bacterium]|nr:VTT domain-containing protein [Candidatus Omnitrophota bacterium]